MSTKIKPADLFDPLIIVRKSLVTARLQKQLAQHHHDMSAIVPPEMWIHAATLAEKHFKIAQGARVFAKMVLCGIVSPNIELEARISPKLGNFKNWAEYKEVEHMERW